MHETDLILPRTAGNYGSGYKCQEGTQKRVYRLEADSTKEELLQKLAILEKEETKLRQLMEYNTRT